MEAALDLSPYVDPLDLAARRSLFPTRPERDLVPPDPMASISLWAPSAPVQTVNLAQCWQELASGRRQIADRAASDEYYFLLLARTTKAVRARRGIRARNFGVLNRVLLTPSRKQLSLEVGLSTSSIAALSKQCLELIGLSCTPCTAPPLLIMAASAQAGKLGFIGERSLLAPGFELIRAPRPELKFASAFSRAEFDVAQRLLEGNSYAEIARRRQTSARTVANQVASIFHRTGVSSRSELAQRLLVESTELSLTTSSALQ
ncbi:MAG TPA: LuxR C-terminal-related transcriptional regulator [Polyangiaceae bacterium]|nr:LuxR C-terminal-related transcriptional regulator [Polyangiaceae bacterium]